MHAQGRERVTERDAAGQEKQLKAPVESECQQSFNCHFMVDSRSKKLTVAEDKKRRSLAKITRYKTEEGHWEQHVVQG